ncbi:hypothetical protein PPAR_a0189 [Pseudoalteromonas paragorgicola KMM 3548]|nr:hypothetical protein [Pseudoalteromonas distincta KMM 3548]
MMFSSKDFIKNKVFIWIKLLRYYLKAPMNKFNVISLL